MTTVFIVTGHVDYEGARVLAAFSSVDAAEYFARRVDMIKDGYDDVRVDEWRGTSSKTIHVLARGW